MKRTKRFAAGLISSLLVFALVLALVPAAGVHAAAGDACTPVDKSASTAVIKPNATTHVNVPIKSDDAGIMVYSLSAKTDTELIRVDNLKLLDYDGNDVLMTHDSNVIFNGSKVALDCDIIADEALKIGYYDITFFAYGIDYNGDFDPGEIQLLTLRVYNATELEDAYILVSEIEYSKSTIYPGDSLNMKITVGNEGDVAAIGTVLSLNFDGTGIIPGYVVSKIRIGELDAHSIKTITIPISVRSDAEAGIKELQATFTAKNKAGEAQGPFEQDLYITITKTGEEEKKDEKIPQPALTLSTEDNYKTFERGSNDKLTVQISNTGEGKAANIEITNTSGFDTTSGITRRYTSDGIAVKSLKKDASTSVEIPVAINADATEGLHELVFKVTYTDSDGKNKNEETITLYINVPAKTKEEIKEDEKQPAMNFLIIDNISQSTQTPAYGQKVTVTFEVTNNGNGDITNLRFCGANLSASGFEPVDNDPYESVGTLKLGETKKVSMTFRCGENIPAGANMLTLNYEFLNADNTIVEDGTSVYVLGVQAKPEEKTEGEKVDVGRPKLIVSGFSTDADMLKAGSSFMFSFTLKNTHLTKDAKNIKITLSQEEGIFAPASGTNIFYIESIEAGEESEQVVELKTRNDAVTGDYTLQLLVEYEYDDMSEVDKEHGGVSEENNIKLRAIENYRPVIENIYIEAWEGVYVGTPVDLSFEFYNMGKSTLGNVYVTVEGDFELANGSAMSYVGAVQGYGQEYVNPQIVPLVSGQAVGTLVVHFEDSNGEEITISQDFESWVDDKGGDWSEGDWGEGDWSEGDMGGDWGEGDWGEIPEEEGRTFKQFIAELPAWAWAIVGAAAVGIIVGIVVLVKTIKKKKAEKEENDEDY